MSLPKKMKDHAVRHAEATEPHPAAAAKQAAQGKLLARLSVSAPADRLEESWLDRLKGTAAQISAALGYSG